MNWSGMTAEKSTSTALNRGINDTKSEFVGNQPAYAETFLVVVTAGWCLAQDERGSAGRHQEYRSLDEA